MAQRKGHVGRWRCQVKYLDRYLKVVVVGWVVVELVGSTINHIMFRTPPGMKRTWSRRKSKRKKKKKRNERSVTSIRYYLGM